MVSTSELLSIVPLILLGVIYFGRDLLLYNKIVVVNKCYLNFSNTQKIVFLVLYPLWILFIWIENIAQKRKNLLVVLIMNIISTFVGWMTVVFILNDEFKTTKQQNASLIFSFIISGLWRVFNILMFDD